MFRYMVAVILVAVAVSGMLVAGCAKVNEAKEAAQAVGQAAHFAKDMQDGKATIKGKDGQEMTIESKGKGDDENMTMTIKNEKGEEVTVAGGKEVDLTGLDIDIYPGASQEGGSRMTDDTHKHISAVFKSTDSFEKVAKFYKDKYPDAQTNEMDMNGQKMLIMTIGEEPEIKSVSLTTEEDSKDINIILSHNTQVKKKAE